MATTEHYLGNKNLKRTDITIEYTPDQLEEYKKCMMDPLYFITTYMKIVHVDYGLIPFTPYKYQEQIIEESVNNRFVICKLPRQAGKTTTITGIILWYILFNENYSVAILANKLAQAREILSRIQLAYEHLPKWLQQGIIEWNKGSMELENGSSIIASATSSSAIRGTSQNLIYLDEFAFVQNHLQEQFFSSVVPTISSGQTTKILITSTPNGLNMFYKIWADSEQGNNSYRRIEVNWWDTPGRDESWKDEMIRNTSEAQFRVEFGCDFVGSSNTLISGETLRRLVHKKPVRETSSLKVYHEPVKKNVYVAVVDTSEGLGMDYTVINMVDVTTIPYQQVAVYRTNEIEPVLIPGIVVELAKAYNEAYVLIETNSTGKQVGDILNMDFEYTNIIYTTSKSNDSTQINGGFGGRSTLGVRTTKLVKRLGCSNLKSLVENDKLIINDFNTIYELSRFSWSGSTFEAEDGYDDIAMTCVLFAWMIDQPYIRELTNSSFVRSLADDNDSLIEQELLPFGFFEDGSSPDEIVNF